MILALIIGFAIAAPLAMAGTVRVEGRDYVSAGSTAAACGMQIQIDRRAGIYTLTDGTRRYCLFPGFEVAQVDGRAVTMEGPVLFQDGDMLIPAGLFALPKAARWTGGEGAIPLKRVVLDPGHGGEDSGALGPTRIREKDVALSVALRLKSLLEAKGVEVVMTRATDRFIPLLDRSAIANRSGADLFLSIHCNANPSGDASGIETFAVSWSITDTSRAQKASAKLEPGDLVDGASRHVSRGAEQAIMSAYMSEQRRQSIELARAIQGELPRRLDETDRGVKFKNLSVLRETYLPASLVEVGFITERETADKMASAAWRQKIAEALAAGIGRYAREEATRLSEIGGCPIPTRQVAGR